MSGQKCLQQLLVVIEIKVECNFQSGDTWWDNVIEVTGCKRVKDMILIWGLAEAKNQLDMANRVSCIMVMS